MSTLLLEQPLASQPWLDRRLLPAFAKLGVLTPEDLLLRKPRRFEDRRPGPERPREDGDLVALRVQLRSVTSRRLRGRMSLVEAEAIPESGLEPLTLRWFNMPYLARHWKDRLPRLFIFGKLTRTGRKWTMTVPEWEAIEDDDEAAIHINRIVPVYSLTEGLAQRAYRRAVFETIRQLPPTLPEWFPRAAAAFEPWRDAVRRLHFPETWQDPERGRQRLAFDEFVVWQTFLAQRRQALAAESAQPIPPGRTLVPQLLEGLGFRPTAAQARVLEEIRADMARDHPMNRLVQGDVGSGKTLVALMAMLDVAEAGFSAALMAPTEILANQHFLNLQKHAARLNLSIGLLTGQRKTRQHGPDLFCGTIRLWVGTHALFQKNVELDKLALVVIDEQHKFGVEQRARLRAKGRAPHTLVMTATPIPRTLGLTAFGDLDVSVIDELPQGRGRIVTAARDESALPKIWDFLRTQLDAGRQAYVVYPVIEESERPSKSPSSKTAADALKAVESETARLTQILAPHAVAAMHGRLDPERKDALMAAFRAGDIRALVSTTVIEVGVDVPNASVMVIENAERFGLAQLHQLRGRIGRGPHKSYCILVSPAAHEEAWTRLKILQSCLDGFRIAEEDLKLRGVGDVLGTLQSGAASFRLGNLTTDLHLIEQARTLALQIVARDPSLSRREHQPLAQRVAGLAQRVKADWVDTA